jgi:hypothetical protein
MDKATYLFNSTKSIINNRQEISELFTELNQSTKQQRNSEEINKIIDEINIELTPLQMIRL